MFLARKCKYHTYTKEIGNKYFWRENSNTIKKKFMQNNFGAKIQKQILFENFNEIF